LPETDGAGSSLVTTDMCLLRNQNIVNALSALKGDVNRNRETNEKLAKIIIGNGEVGLVERVNLLTFRNQLIDKTLGIVISIISTLITLWATGVLRL